MDQSVDIGGGFVLYRAPSRQPVVVATALTGTGASGFASPPEVDARLDADAIAWLDSAGLLQGRRLISLDQVHGASCAAAAEATAERVPAAVSALENTDAVWTRSPDDALIIRTADCAAMWLADPEHGQLAIVHAGWRGAADGIVRNTVDALRANGARPRSTIVAIGPHLGPCCFEVGPQVAAHFTDIDGAVAPGSRLTAPRQRQDSLALDLGAVLVAQLLDTGISRDSIHVASACTRCWRSDDGTVVLHSYRRNGKGGPLMASIGFLER